MIAMAAGQLFWRLVATAIPSELLRTVQFLSFGNLLLTANLVPPFGYQFSTSIYPTAVQVVPHSLLPVAGCSQDVLLAARLHPAYMLGEEGSQETSKCEDLPHQKR